MKIAIDLRVFNWTGIGRVANGIAENIFRLLPEHQYIYILNPGQGESISAPNITKEYIQVPTFDLREHFQIQKVIKKYPDLKIFHALHFNIPWFLSNRVKLVTNVYDLAFDEFPDEARTILHRLYYSVFIRATLKRSSAVITQSDYTAKDLNQRYGYSKGIPLYPGFEGNYLEKKADSETKLPERFIFYVGLNKPRKNLRALVTAYEQCLKVNPNFDVDLVIAGKMAGEVYEIEKDVQSRGLSKRVHLLGFVSDQLLTTLYSKALLYVCPSILESGYSYPVLEAATFGVPILANSRDMTEFGKNFIEYCDMQNSKALAEKILNLCKNPNLRSELGAKAKLLPEQYKWTDYIERLGKIYKQVAQS